MGAEADFLHFMLAVSLVFSEWECSVTDCIFLSAAALRFYIGFPFGRRTLFLHSHCCLALCEPAATELKSKNAHGASRIFNGVFYTDSFFDLSFWCKGIPNGFASVTACGCLGSDCPVICRYLVYIYCPKESKCRHLQNPSKIPLSCQGTNILPLIKQVPHTCKIRQIRSISVRKKTFAYVKLNTNLPQTNHLICRQNQ